ncbi:MAG: amidohydrolase [Chloroflexi bacterium]|nr:amidohydrolase [Chloroflexota bacterium]
MTKDEAKREALAALEAAQEDIIGLAHDLLRHPETGYREVRTAEQVAAAFAARNIPHRRGLALTGVKGTLRGRSAGPTVAVLGEMDSLIVPDHPYADPVTGAAHACGHHGQVAAMLGVARALTDSGVIGHLDGNVALFAVPAEELIDVEYRQELRRQGKIAFMGGKAELIHLGEFDDIQAAMLCHAASGAFQLGIPESTNGFVTKVARFRGRSSHAAASPHRGINALYAATLALDAINAQRETFRDEDHVRVHPILTKGGDVVNAIPAEVRLETFVRARTREAIEDAARKVDRALKAGALAMGAAVTITTLPGYLPLINHPALVRTFRENAVALAGEEAVVALPHVTASTDMGDLSQVLPVVQPSVAGSTGSTHGPDFVAVDEATAYLLQAKALALTVIDLLWDGARRAREVAATRPAMTKAEYLAYLREMEREETFTGLD